MSDLYVYYRVAQPDVAALLPRVAAMLTGLQRMTGVAGQLKQRPLPEASEPTCPEHTWMEVYLSAPAGFEAVLAAAVIEADLLPLIAGARHHELFTDLIPCA